MWGQLINKLGKRLSHATMWIFLKVCAMVKSPWWYSVHQELRKTKIYPFVGLILGSFASKLKICFPFQEWTKYKRILFWRSLKGQKGQKHRMRHNLGTEPFNPQGKVNIFLRPFLGVPKFFNVPVNGIHKVILNSKK